MSSVPGSDSSDGRRQNVGNVALVIVTHNSAAALHPLFDSIAASSTDVISQVAVVDNASADASVEQARLRLATATIIFNANNLGFARAVNQGAKATSADFILLANPDVKWSDGTISQLAQFLAEHSRAAAVCPRLVFPDGGAQSSVRRFPTHSNIWLSRQSPLRFLRHLFPSRMSYTVSDPESPERVEAIAATFMMIKRGAFNAVGGMDEAYFLYVEDTDICKRWHDRGFEVWIDPTLTVTHDWQGGSGNRHQLRRHHRDGIRHYFRVHHADKPIRNSLLGIILSLASLWDHVGRSDTGDPRT